jgi:hypothetical protein
MTGQINSRSENQTSASTDLISLLSQKVVGQSSATKAIVPYVCMYQSGLAPEGRPAGVFLLLGPTGTGKTKTVEAIAELLHGSDIIMTGGGLSDSELMLCAERKFPILFKPFLAQDILNFIRGAYRRTFAAGAGSISTAESKTRTGSV